MTIDGPQRALFRRQCEFCSAVLEVQVHHVDWDHDNNAPENLMRLCHFCHTAVHQLGAIVPEQLRVVRELVELERRLFEGGAPLDGMKERRSLIDAVVGHRGRLGRLARSWAFVEGELRRIAALGVGSGKGSGEDPLGVRKGSSIGDGWAGASEQKTTPAGQPG